jgi:CubicO group peptidase (beta-lactamase class C family)
MINKCIQLFIITLVLFPCQMFSHEDLTPQEKEVCALFRAWGKPDSPGGAIVVVKDGKVVFQRGFGCADLEHNIPITPKTVFKVGSTAKHFTALAITVLSVEGKLSLDDDVRDYVPEVPEFSHKITIRQLLNHTSGLRDYAAAMMMLGLSEAVTKQHFFKYLRRQQRLNFAPGSAYAYSNTGYVLAAEIVARVTEKSFREWTKERFFDPLVMSSSIFQDDYTVVVKGSADSYSGSQETGYHRIIGNDSNVGPSGLMTSVEDLGKWILNYEGEIVGNKKMFEILMEKGKLNDGSEIDYGMGTLRGVYRGAQWFGHGGGTAGFRSDLTYFPKQKFGVAVLCNLVNINPSDIVNKIADIYLADQLEPVAAQAGARERESIEIDPEIFDGYSGYYRLSDGSILSLGRWHTRYFAGIVGGRSYEIFPGTLTTFFSLEHPATTIQFIKDTDGRVNRLMINIGGSECSGRRFAEEEPDEKALAHYTGNYYCSELDTVFRIVYEKSQWKIKHSRVADIKLILTEKDRMLGGFIMEFTRSADDQVDGFILSTQRLRNLHFKKIS